MTLLPHEEHVGFFFFISGKFCREKRMSNNSVLKEAVRLAFVGL